MLITFRALTNELLSHTHVGIGDTIAGQMLVAVKKLFHTGNKDKLFFVYGYETDSYNTNQLLCFYNFSESR